MDEDLTLFATDHAKKLGAEYVDARLEAHYNELITVANGKVERAMINHKRGIGVRTLVNGAWGFQSTTNLSKTGVRRATSIAFRIANASSRHVPKRVKLASTKEYRDSYVVVAKTDLEDVSFEEKIKMMLEWEKNLHTSKAVVRGLIEYTGIKIDKIFVNSEGANIKFANTLTWSSLKADTKRGDLTQSYERVVGHSGGYEIFERQDMGKVAREIGEKADSLLKAEPAKEEKTMPVIINPDYLALLCHEIVGHPSEADRVLGREAAWAAPLGGLIKLTKKLAPNISQFMMTQLCLGLLVSIGTTMKG